MRASRSARSASVQIQVSNAALIFASFSLAASVSAAFSTRFLTPSSLELVVDLRERAFSASSSSSPAWRRAVPHSVEELASAGEGADLIDQQAISTV